MNMNILVSTTDAFYEIVVIYDFFLNRNWFFQSIAL